MDIKLRSVFQINDTAMAVLEGGEVRIITFDGEKISLGKQVEVEDRVVIDKLFPSEIKRGQTWTVQFRYPGVVGMEDWGFGVFGLRNFLVENVMGDAVYMTGPNSFSNFKRAEFTEGGAEMTDGGLRRFILDESSRDPG